MPTQTQSREGLAALYGHGRATFYAKFGRYGLKTFWAREPVCGEWRTLLIQVMDENLQPVADHVWCDLPRWKKDDCWWALPPDQPLLLEASVGTYKKHTGETSYNFAPVWYYEKLKRFPVETPAMVSEYNRFFNRVITDPKLMRFWLDYSGLRPRLHYPEIKFEVS